MFRRYVLLMLVLSLMLVGCGSALQAQQPTGPTSMPPAPTVTPESAEPTPLPTMPPSPTFVPSPTTEIIPTTTPTEAPSPTMEPPPATATPAPREISIAEPVPDALVSAPVTVRGSTTFWPFEASLLVRIRDADGNVLGSSGVMVEAPDIGQGGPFAGEIPFTSPAAEQDGVVEVLEQSARDGSTVTIQSVRVRLAAAPAPEPDPLGIMLDAPHEGEEVTLPLHVALRVADPSVSLRARVRFPTGTMMEEPLDVVAGTDGVGYAVANLNWNTESHPGPFGPGPMTLELLRDDGSVAKSIGLTLLPDEATQWVEVAWTATGAEDDLIIFRQRVPATPQIASAALRELLRGSQDGNLAGAITALPTYRDIVTYPGREADWGYQVELIKLTIEEGVAKANFSREMWAYGGGSARVLAIRAQIERTLRQFPSVQEVVIMIDGQQEGVLEP